MKELGNSTSNPPHTVVLWTSFKSAGVLFSLKRLDQMLWPAMLLSTPITLLSDRQTRFPILRSSRCLETLQKAKQVCVLLEVQNSYSVTTSVQPQTLRTAKQTVSSRCWQKIECPVFVLSGLLRIFLQNFLFQMEVGLFVKKTIFLAREVPTIWESSHYMWCKQLCCLGSNHPEFTLMKSRRRAPN